MHMHKGQEHGILIGQSSTQCPNGSARCAFITRGSLSLCLNTQTALFLPKLAVSPQAQQATSILLSSCIPLQDHQTSQSFSECLSLHSMLALDPYHCTPCYKYIHALCVCEALRLHLPHISYCSYCGLILPGDRCRQNCSFDST